MKSRGPTFYRAIGIIGVLASMIGAGMIISDMGRTSANLPVHLAKTRHFSSPVGSSLRQRMSLTEVGPAVGSNRGELASDGSNSEETLGEFVLDLNQNPDERRRALSVLTQAGVQALPVLQRVVESPFALHANAMDPHSTAHYQFQFEKGLRITALEAIDQWSARGVDVTQALNSILSKSVDADIHFLASLSLGGIEQGRPGKLERFINEILEKP